jgi:putative hemolysin
MRMARRAVRVAVIVLLCGVAIAAVGQNAKSKTAPAVDPSVAYCVATGGALEVRHAVYGTNNPQQDWLWLGAEEDFCQYTLASDGSRIHLSLETLTQTRPTLAALAYYAQVPWNGQGNGNPASFYCTQLGGAEIGATNLAGGAWVSTGGLDKTLEACIFPDNSTIDSWGLLYHSANIIRGIDLSTVLKYANPYGKKKE